MLPDSKRVRSRIVEHNLVGRMQDWSPFRIKGSQSEERAFWRLKLFLFGHCQGQDTGGRPETAAGTGTRWSKLS